LNKALALVGKFVSRPKEAEKFAGWPSLPLRGGGERARVRGATEKTIGKARRGGVFATDGSRTVCKGG